VLSYLVKMIYKIHERIVGRNMRDERTIKLLYSSSGWGIRMDYLVSNFNVYSTAIRAVESLGWEVSTSQDGVINSNIKYNWVATKSECKLIAVSPIELLGMAQLHSMQFKGDYSMYWWEIKGDKNWLDYVPKNAV
jgi:hypothetical protein